MTRTTRNYTYAVVLVLTAACGGSVTGGNNTPGGNANFSAKIDNVQWNALTISTSAIGSPSGTFSLTGSNSVTSTPTSLSLVLRHISANGTYPLGVTGTVPGGIVTMSSGSSAWSTPNTGAAGSVQITNVSATRLAGSFSFVATPVFGSTANRTVTAGTFDLPITSTGSVAVPEEAGSKLTGTLANAAWNAAAVVMVTSPSSGTLTFAASNDVYTVNVLVSQYAGVGTYALGSGVARYATVTTLVNGTKTWGGTNALASGALIVTSANNKRISGTLNFTLQPGIASPGPGTMAFTGTFSVGIAQ